MPLARSRPAVGAPSTALTPSSPARAPRARPDMAAGGETAPRTSALPPATDALAPILARAVQARAAREPPIRGPLLQREGNDEDEVTASLQLIGAGLVIASMVAGLLWYYVRSPAAGAAAHQTPQAKPRPQPRQLSIKQLRAQDAADAKRRKKEKADDPEEIDRMLADVARVLRDDWTATETSGALELAEIGSLAKGAEAQRKAIGEVAGRLPPEGSKGYDASALRGARAAQKSAGSKLEGVEKRIAELRTHEGRSRVDKALREREDLLLRLRRATSAWKQTGSNQAADEVRELYNAALGPYGRGKPWKELAAHVAEAQVQALQVTEHFVAADIEIPVHVSSHAKEDKEPVVKPALVGIAPPKGPPPVDVDRPRLRERIGGFERHAGETSINQCITGIENGEGTATGTTYGGREVRHISHGVAARGDGCTVFYDVDGRNLTVLGVGQHVPGYRARYRFSWKDDSWAHPFPGDPERLIKKFVSEWVIDLERK